MRTISTSRRVALIALVPSIATAMLWGADSAPQAETSAKTRASVIAAYRKNIEYCMRWTAAADTKSLSRTAEQLPILTDALARYADENGRKEIDGLRESVDGLLRLARANREIEEYGMLLLSITSRLDRIEKMTGSGNPSDVKKSSVGFNPLMSLIDGTFADGKTAASVGDAAEAKSYALVLAELGEMLAKERNDERWKTHSHDLVDAAKQAAAATTEAPKQLRAVFHTVYERCEACHAVRRPQGAK